MMQMTRRWVISRQTALDVLNSFSDYIAVVDFDELLSTDLCNDDAALPLPSVQLTGFVIHVINSWLLPSQSQEINQIEWNKIKCTS